MDSFLYKTEITFFRFPLSVQVCSFFCFFFFLFFFSELISCQGNVYMFENSWCLFRIIFNLLYNMYGINRIEINKIYSVIYHALIDKLVTAMKYLFIDFPQGRLYFFCTWHLSLKSTLHNTQSMMEAFFQNVLTVVSFEDLPNWNSWAKIHAFSLE